MNGMGVEPWIVEKCLNHKLIGVMKTYNLAEYLPEREKALTAWGNKIKQIVSGDNIINIAK